ncbi:uncharacterized protein [Amphiura filiformis]|uniref:uncharacterized protein isoform X3 n=1 Tax=Amphiura filiformis TaxID=82378 RepID=UPI003B223E9F
MSRLLLICLAFTACIISVIRAKQIPVPVSTRYITTATSTLRIGESKTFIASLCQQFAGETVNAAVLLYNNPSWQPAMGIVYYYIVDDPTKTQKDALCNNTDKVGQAGPRCVIQKWISRKDLYLKVIAGNVDAISFSIDIYLQKNTTKGIVKDSKTRNNYAGPGYTKPSTSRLHLKVDTEYLTEIVTIEANQRLGYYQEALLEITFCPNPKTTDHYKITSTVVGTDVMSSFSQYICVKLPCEIDSPNVVALNGKALPINEVTMTTSSGQYSHIYVLIVCWSGQLDPTYGIVGEFQYRGTLMREE